MAIPNPLSEVRAVRRIRQARQKHDVLTGIHTPSGEWAKKHAGAGFDVVTVATRPYSWAPQAGR